MFFHAVLFQFFRALFSTPPGAALAIFVGVLIQEDVTTVAVGMMAADHLVAVPLAIACLIIGTMLNDFGLYGIGRLAITHPRLRRWVEHERRLPLRAWLNGRLVSTVVTTQFLPGMRLPIFAACGFFALSFRRFAFSVVGIVLVWSPLIFACSYFYGVYTFAWFGLWRWSIALAALFMLALAGRSYWRHLAKAGNMAQPD